MGSSIFHYIQRLTVIVLLLCTFPVLGATVGLLVEEKNPQVKRFHADLIKSRPQDQIKLYTLKKLPKDLATTNNTTWLAMGTKPLAVLLGRMTNNKNQPRILGLFVRPEAREKLSKLYPNKSFSLLDNTPPLSRQLALIKVLDPTVSSVAVLHSKSSKIEFEAINAQAKEIGIQLNYAVIDNPLNWGRDSLNVLKNTDLVLGVNDMAIYNATTIRSILMRLYRASRPLIGPDKGYVKAGAVASTYSGVNETIKALAELLAHDKKWPAKIINPYFSVTVNNQVARSLNINITDTELLSLQVKEALK